jgi:hypothetical protein
MACAAQHGTHGVAKRPLKPIAVELAMGLYVADRRLDRTATPNHGAAAGANPVFVIGGTERPFVRDSDTQHPSWRTACTLSAIAL